MTRIMGWSVPGAVAGVAGGAAGAEGAAALHLTWMPPVWAAAVGATIGVAGAIVTIRSGRTPDHG